MQPLQKIRVILKIITFICTLNYINMGIEKKKTATKGLFGKENYRMMLGGLIVLAIGFFLMAGGKSADPTVFKDSDVYSTTRITIAPILIIVGFIIEIFAIMKKPKEV
jgi:Protein of unknown function (DUF3098)